MQYDYGNNDADQHVIFPIACCNEYRLRLGSRPAISSTRAETSMYEECVHVRM